MNSPLKLRIVDTPESEICVHPMENCAYASYHNQNYLIISNYLNCEQPPAAAP